MNYNTNRTIQAVCAKALIYQADDYGGSCHNLTMASALVWVGFETGGSLMKDYRLHSGAYTEDYGFYPFSLRDWIQFSLEAKQTYRLEMLYYFWLANQDSMDAFS